MTRKIYLRCSHANFPHLIGLHYAAERVYGIRDGRTKRFKGFTAYTNIKNGVIDKQTISNLHKQSYGDIKKKIKFFFLAHKVLADPSAIEFNKLNCDVLLYKDFFGKRIHIGLKLTRDKAVPITFLIEDLGSITFTKEPQVIVVHKILKHKKLLIKKNIYDKLRGQ